MRTYIYLAEATRNKVLQTFEIIHANVWKAVNTRIDAATSHC